MDVGRLTMGPSDQAEPAPPPFTFASTFPEAKSQSDHIAKIRGLDDTMLGKIYSEGIRLEKLDQKLEKEVAANCLCERDIEEAHRLKQEVDAERDQTSKALTKEYKRAQNNKLLFGWSLGLGIPTIAALAGWGFYLRHKQKQEKKQLQELLQVAASEGMTTPGPTSQGATSKSR